MLNKYSIYSLKVGFHQEWYISRRELFWGKSTDKKVGENTEKEILGVLKSKYHLEIVLLVSLADRCTEPGRAGDTKMGPQDMGDIGWTGC